MRLNAFHIFIDLLDVLFSQGPVQAFCPFSVGLTFSFRRRSSHRLNITPLFVVCVVNYLPFHGSFHCCQQCLLINRSSDFNVQFSFSIITFKKNFGVVFKIIAY